MPRTNGLRVPGIEPGQALSRLSYTSCEVCAVFARLTSGWLRMGYAQQIDGMVHPNSSPGGDPDSLPFVFKFFRRQYGTSSRSCPCISLPRTRCTTDQTPVTMCGLLACRGRPEHRPKLWSYASTVWSGADDGVRSRTASLEGWNAANYITSADIRQH